MTRASENTDKGGTDREDSHALEKMKFRTKCFEKQLTLLAPLISHVCIPGICVLTLLLSIGLVPPATVLLFGGSLACWTVALAPGFLLRLIDMILNRRGRNDSSEAEETACSVSSLRERISFLAMMGHIICFHVGDVVNKKPPVLRAQEHGHHGGLLKLGLMCLHYSDFHFFVLFVLDTVLHILLTFGVIAEEIGPEDREEWCKLVCVHAFFLGLLAVKYREGVKVTIEDAFREVTLREKAEKARKSFLSYIMHEM